MSRMLEIRNIRSILTAQFQPTHESSIHHACTDAGWSDNPDPQIQSHYESNHLIRLSTRCWETNPNQAIFRQPTFLIDLDS